MRKLRSISNETGSISKKPAINRQENHDKKTICKKNINPKTMIEPPPK
jgi:hypothetical protein